MRLDETALINIGICVAIVAAIALLDKLTTPTKADTAPRPAGPAARLVNGSMWALCRLLLIGLVLGAGALTFVLGADYWPFLALVLALGFWQGLLKPRYKPTGDAFGTAHWATPQQLAGNGCFGNDGIAVGYAMGDGGGGGGLAAAIGGLFDKPFTPEGNEAACRALMGDAGGAGRMIRIPDYCHLMCAAPSGRGKGVSLVIPTLLSWNRGSVVVTDPKGELWDITHRYRRDVLGQRVIKLDPFNVCPGEPSDTFNPLSLCRSEEEAIDFAKACAAALVVRGKETESHWGDKATELISAFITLALVHPEIGRSPDEQSIPAVRQLITGLYDESLDALAGLGDTYAAIVGGLRSIAPEELSGVKSSVSRHLNFVDSPAVHRCLLESSFDPGELRNGNLAIYLILPPSAMVSQSRLMRIWITSLVHAVSDGGMERYIDAAGEERQRECLFLLDEVGNFGKDLPAIEQGLTILRGYGGRFMLIFQSFDQAKTLVDGKPDLCFDNCDTQCLFGVNPGGGTAKAISETLGDYTQVLESFSENQSRSWTEAGPCSPGQGVNHSRSTNRSFSEQRRSLLTLDEVRRLDDGEMLVLHRNLPPILARRMVYYRDPFFRGKFKRRRT